MAVTQRASEKAASRYDVQLTVKFLQKHKTY